MAETSGRYRPKAARVALMAAFALVALAAFVLLWDVRFNHPEVDGDPVFGVTADHARISWTIVLLACEATALGALLLLLFIHPRGSPQDAAPWLDESWTETATVAAPDTTSLQIGCPGCGTVFEKASTDVDEPHEQEFRCPNCGRAGRLRMGVHRAVPLRERQCVNCGRAFQAYRDTAECPHCHAAQA